jgi:hypothetical protein
LAGFQLVSGFYMVSVADHYGDLVKVVHGVIDKVGEVTKGQPFLQGVLV